MTTVRVRYLVDDVETAIEFYRERLEFAVDLTQPPASRSSRAASYGCC